MTKVSLLEEDTVSVCKNDEGEFTGRKHSTGRTITLSENWFPPDTYHYWLKLLDIRGDVTIFTYESLLSEQWRYQKLADIKKIIEPEEGKDDKGR